MRTLRIYVTIGKANRYFTVDAVEENAVEMYKEFCELVKAQAGQRAELTYKVVADLTEDRATGCKFNILTAEKLEKMIAYRK